MACCTGPPLRERDLLAYCNGRCDALDRVAEDSENEAARLLALEKKISAQRSTIIDLLPGVMI